MELIAICGLLYLLWVVTYLWWSNRSNLKKSRVKEVIAPSKSGDIMGASKAANRQITPNTAKQSHAENTAKESVTFAAEAEKRYSAVIKKEELDAVFSDNQMDIDVDADYSADDDTQMDDIPCYEGGAESMGNGVDFPEMDNLAKVIAQKEQRKQLITKAAETVRKIENTGLYDAVIAGYENGLQKVAAMLAKYEANQPANVPMGKMESYEEFELNNFL